MTIVSRYNGGVDGQSGAVMVKYKELTTGTEQTKILTPDNSIEILGRVENAAGNLEVTSSKNISVPISTTEVANRLAAAGTLSLTAGGAVIQSYTAGVTNVGGDPTTLWQKEVEDVEKNRADGYVTTNNDVRSHANSAIVAGNDVIISGEMINLNGLVQSGFAQYGIELSETDLNSKVLEIKKRWAAAGCPSNINPLDSAYSLTQSGSYQLKDGSYAYQVASWYDPVTDKILVEDITPTGGSITITGRIASTGNGKLVAAAGAATVNIAAGSHNVQLGDISTGSVSGSVKIVDTNFADSAKGYVAKVTEYSDGKTLVGWQTSDGTLADTSESDGYSQYNPLKGLRYLWSTGSRTGTYYDKRAEQRFSWWNLKKYDWKDNDFTTVKKEEVKNTALSTDKTISVMTPLNNENYSSNEFVGWGTVIDETESQHDRGNNTTYDDWTHFSGTHHGWDIYSVTQTNTFTFALKADHAVEIGTMQGSNAINVTTSGTLTLGGALTATKGRVVLTGDKGIIAASSDAGIFNASSVTLSAADGAIGSAQKAIRITGSEGTVALSATAKDDIVIDASALAQNAKVEATNVTSEKGDVTLASRGDLSIADLAGHTIKLTSNDGSIRVTNRAIA